MTSQPPGQWGLYGGRDPRELPSYTSSEAARYVRIPLRTVQNWAFGSRGRDPLIHVADPSRHLLSFWNVVELHVLGALRRASRISPKNLRAVIRFLEEKFNNQHPLLTKSMHTDGISVFVARDGLLINASRGGQLAIRQLIEAHLARIEQHFDGMPVRLFPFVRHDPYDPPMNVQPEPKVILLDPRVRFGRPVIVGTGIPTEEIAERFRAGDTCGQLADEFGQPAVRIEEALRYHQIPGYLPPPPETAAAATA
jgi:uncharacterized protein (DUF433 family)